MGRAKIASGNKGVVAPKRNDWPGYIRFGYRMPNGLVVTRVGTQIGDPLDGQPWPISFVDHIPVTIPESINFDHVGEVLAYALSESVRKDLEYVQELNRDLTNDRCPCGCGAPDGLDDLMEHRINAMEDVLYPPDSGDENDDYIDPSEHDSEPGRIND